MANQNPVAARRARKRRPKAGTVKQLTDVLWNAITKLEEAIEPPMIIQVGDVTRLVHSLSQAGGVYLKAIEVGELEARVAELERQAEMQR